MFIQGEKITSPELKDYNIYFDSYQPENLCRILLKSESGNTYHLIRSVNGFSSCEPKKAITHPLTSIFK